MAASACVASSLAVSTSSSLRSSFVRPCSFRERQYAESRFLAAGRCVAQMAMPKLAEAFQSGMGLELQESLVGLQHDILRNAVELGLPADENVLSYWAIAVPVVLWYSLATPGPLAGLVEFFQGPMHANTFRSFSPEDVEIGRQMGEGSFGIVHEGYIGKGKKKQGKKETLHVVLKKVKSRVKGATEMRDAEIHMNQRLQRTAPGACAEFLGTVDVSSSQSHGKLTEGVWLVWQFQGERTLDHYMKQKNFPENIAETILGKKVTEKGASKKELKKQYAAVVRTIMKQLLINLRDLHASGVVHRDVKPLNLVLAEDSGSFKLIDLGACVDIRSGFNYTPDETVIDPTYAAPEHYVMPTSTPALPPDPLCSVVSPLLWLLNTPDRFDLFSAGLILMQLSVRQLRYDVGLETFNSELKRAGYDLDVWRRRCHISKEEFALLDADDGLGWELAKAMLQPRHDKNFFIWPSLGSSRPSAAAALHHRFIQGSSFPQPIELPKLIPDFPALATPTSVGQIKVPVLSASSMQSAFSQLENIQDAAAEVDMDQVGTAMAAAMPMAATGGLAFITGWLLLVGLQSSAEVTYNMGHWVVEYMGVSGSAFLAFFLIIKPWLEQQDVASRINKRSSHLSTEADQLAFTGFDIGASSLDTRVQEILATRQRQPGTQRLKTGLSEAVLAMEAQLASLEASISHEREFSVHQQELVMRMEKLLCSPPPTLEEQFSTLNDTVEVPSSGNGAYLAKPFSGYVS
ncbi:unnamed protein product [Sphagnum troendelagicum]